jgi:hypothetical protein
MKRPIPLLLEVEPAGFYRGWNVNLNGVPIWHKPYDGSRAEEAADEFLAVLGALMCAKPATQRSGRKAKTMTDPDPDLPEDDAYGLVMPFVSVASVGGPFDDMAFACGFDCGQLFAELEICARLGATPMPRQVKTGILDQLDLIAMTHKFTVAVGEKDESGEWVGVEFAAAAR